MEETPLDHAHILANKGCPYIGEEKYAGIHY
jgi:hypothetical protein